MKKLLAALAIVVVVVYVFDIGGEVKRPPGVLAPDEPSQWLLSGPSWTIGQDRLTALARYRIRARVISTERYWLGMESRFSPVDFAVGWGPLSDQRILDQISFSQSRRYFHYYPRGRSFPLPVDEINSHSANMHMVPADSGIRKQLLLVRPGDIADMDGYLLLIQTKEGGTWRSSLSRTDSGGGACELMWVEHLSVQ